MTVGQMTEKLRSELDAKRFAHSVAVADTARALARRHGADEEKAYLAGLLHDCGKRMGGEDMLAYARAHGIEADSYQIAAPGLLHAKIGRDVAWREYGVRDEAVLTAIERHIHGVPDLSMLDLLINLADYVEPGRQFPGVAEIRRLSTEDPHRALALALRGSIRLVLDKQMLLHPATVVTYNALLLREV